MVLQEQGVIWLMYRKDPLVTGEVYHVFNKSIAKFTVFNNDPEYMRMLLTVRYYQKSKRTIKLSRALRSLDKKGDFNFGSYQEKIEGDDNLVDIIAFCIMPTHLHLILMQLQDNGISRFMNNVLNSYSKYFNIKHNRKGPLWEGRFQSVLVNSDEQLLHLTRYIHLNPVTAYLVDNPELWPASSYNEYLSKMDDKMTICNYNDLLDIEPNSYRKFVEDRVSYQRELKAMKDLILE